MLITCYINYIYYFNYNYNICCININYYTNYIIFIFIKFITLIEFIILIMTTLLNIRAVLFIVINTILNSLYQFLFIVPI